VSIIPVRCKIYRAPFSDSACAIRTQEWCNLARVQVSWLVGWLGWVLVLVLVLVLVGISEGKTTGTCFLF
jgi:hypothetical protein